MTILKINDINKTFTVYDSMTSTASHYEKALITDDYNRQNKIKELLSKGYKELAYIEYQLQKLI